MLPQSIVSVDDAQAFLAELFSNADRSEDYIYGYLARYSGYMCKKIWQERVSPGDFIRTISWLLAVCTKADIKLESAFLNRFPGICPYCMTSPCACLDTDKSPVAYVPPYRVAEELAAKASVFRNVGEVISFEKTSGIVTSIYPNNKIVWSFGGPWRHLVKIQEEIAEVHEALSLSVQGRSPNNLLEEEVADAFAWIMSAWSICFKEKKLTDEFISYYLNGCPVCSENPCSCLVRSERPTAFVSDKVIEELQSQITELRFVLNQEIPEMDEASKSLEAAAEQKSEPVTLGAIRKTRDAVKQVEATVDFADRNAKKISGITASILKILEAFGV